MPQPVSYRGMSLIVPDNDSEWKEYYAHARQHRLMLRACNACGLMRYPAMHACPWCMDLGWMWKEVSGRGTIYSYETVVHAIQPGFKDATPYPSSWWSSTSSARSQPRTRHCASSPTS